MTDLISYESKRPTVLEPGEQVVWESTGRASKLIAGERVCLITDRRAIVTDEPAEALQRPMVVKSAVLGEVRSVSMRYRRKRKATITLDGRESVKLTDLPEWREPLRLINRAVAEGASQRVLRRGRRSGATQVVVAIAVADDLPAPGIHPMNDEAITAGRRRSETVLRDADFELDLLPGERILWTGRPRPREPLDGTALLGLVRRVAWLCAPAALIAARWAGVIAATPDLHVLLVIAWPWLVIGLWRLLVSPHRRAWRLRRTVYTLTTLRAISVFQTGRRTIFASEFLDLAPTLRFDERPDGYGTIHIGSGLSFDAVPQAAAIHRQIAEAIQQIGAERATGTSAPRPPLE